MILNCTCYHPAQDKLHGKHKRVHNMCRRTTGNTKFRCTVCSTEREASGTSFVLNPVEQAKLEGTK